jgi:hypothetical protein
MIAMWTSRRLSQWLTVLSMAMVIYAVYVGLILRQINKYFIGCTLSSSSKRVPDGCIELFGKFIPWWELFVLWAIWPVGWCVCAIYARIQSAYRARHNLCPSCGHAISNWHGCCPGCGERIGPDGHRVHTLGTRVG